MTSAALTALLACGMPAKARAVTVNDIFGADAARALGASFDAVAELRFSSGGSGYSLCSGSLISSTTVLTAQHCTHGFQPTEVQAIFDVAGTETTVGVSQIHNFAGYDDNNLLTGADIAILELDQALTSVAPYSFTMEFIVGEEAHLVGYGRNGLGSTGDQGTRDGERWAAKNIVDAWAYGTSEMTGENPLYFADFDSPDGTGNNVPAAVGVSSSSTMLDAEGSGAPGDSGGPLLVDRLGEWVIAGVLTGAIIEANGQSYPSDAAYGSLPIWTSVASSEAKSFVTMQGNATQYVAPVPVPPTFVSFALGLGLLGWIACEAQRTRVTPRPRSCATPLNSPCRASPRGRSASEP